MESTVGRSVYARWLVALNLIGAFWRDSTRKSRMIGLMGGIAGVAMVWTSAVAIVSAAGDGCGRCQSFVKALEFCCCPSDSIE